MHAGTISTVYAADASDLLAAQAKIAQVAKASSKVWDDVRAKLGLTARAYDDVGAAADNAGRKGSEALPRLTADAERAQSKMAQLRERAGAVDEKMGKLQTAIGGVSGAFGVSGGKMAGFVGGLADISMAFAAGGPLLAGATAAVVAVTAYSQAVEEATRLENSWRQSLSSLAAAARSAVQSSLDPMRDAVKSITDEVKNFGKSANQIALESTLQQLDAMNLSISTMERNQGAQQAKVNSAESALYSAKAKGVGVDEAQEAYDFQKQILDVEKARLAALKESIPEVESAVLKLSAGIATLKDKMAASTGSRAGPATQKPAAETAYERGMHADLGMFAGGNYGRAAEVPFEWPAAPEMPDTIVINDVEDATGAFIDQMNEDFLAAGKVVKDLRSPLEQFANALGTSSNGLTSLVGALAGGGFGGAGAALAGAAGAGIGVMLGDPTGAIGGAIGSLLGGIFGDALDELVSSLGVLSPFFDGVAVAMGALQPILAVVGVLMGALGEVLEIMAPSILLFARPIAAVALVFVRIVEIAVPLFGAFNAMTTTFWQFLDLLTIWIRGLDENFYRPLIEGARKLYNAFVDVVNTVVDWGRRIFGDDFGVKMTKISTYVDDVIGGFGKTVEEGADKVAQAFEGAETNIPVGYRVPYYDAEVPDGRESAGVAGGGASITTIYNIGTLKLVPTKPRISEALREELLQLRGRSVFQPGGDDDTN